jgi:hypothetical protein
MRIRQKGELEGLPLFRAGPGNSKCCERKYYLSPADLNTANWYSMCSTSLCSLAVCKQPTLCAVDEPRAELYSVLEVTLLGKSAVADINDMNMQQHVST